MKSFLLNLIAFSCFSTSFAQDTLTNFKENQKIAWGSLSAQKPNYGFYGQEFQFSNDIELYSFSVYIFNPPDHDETKSSINFSIWSFDTIPQKEMFLSEAVTIKTGEISNWKSYKFKTPYKLAKGNYLFAVGQSQVQGFIAFGNGIAKDNYQSKFWVKAPFDGYSDGTKWFDLKKLASTSVEEPVVMMRLAYK